jgi:hypothetical protein
MGCRARAGYYNLDPTLFQSGGITMGSVWGAMSAGDRQFVTYLKLSQQANKISNSRVIGGTPQHDRNFWLCHRYPPGNNEVMPTGPSHGI